MSVKATVIVNPYSRRYDWSARWWTCVTEITPDKSRGRCADRYTATRGGAKFAAKRVVRKWAREARRAPIKPLIYTLEV